MKNNLIKIFIGLLLMLGGWQLAEYASSLVSKKDIELKEDLCKNAMTTAGFLTDSVTEITMKIG